MPRVLIIEDEPGIVESLDYALRTEGFEVVWRSTARAGLEALEEMPCDLVLLDIGLPDGSGLDVCRQLRQEGDVPIIFLTARSGEVDRIVGLELGADDYVVKPFSPREVSARVKAVLRRTAGSESGSGAASGFRVDEHRCRITYHGVALELNRQEYRLLRELVRRPGWVFSREQLMRQAWDDANASLERTVDTHIKTIRAKLRQVRPEANPIETHRGLGYALAAP